MGPQYSGMIVALLLFLLLFGCTKKIDDQKSAAGSGIPISGVQQEEKALVKIESHAGYDLVLPADYSQNGLLYCFYPSRDSGAYVEALKPLAEDSGLIVAVSKNPYSEEYLANLDDPIAEIQESHGAADVYLCGFSGGCQIAYIVAYLNPGLADGIICNDGQLPVNQDGRVYVGQNFDNSGRFDSSVVEKVVILSGDRDTVQTPDNLKRDAEFLRNAGIKTRWISFSGGHQIAPVGKYLEALEWLEKN